MSEHTAEKERVREMTVEQLIEQLQAMPPHHFVSPMVDGVLGVGITVWQMFDPQTNDTIVVFGESKREASPIVPPSWSHSVQQSCNWDTCRRAARADGKCFAWCKCRCHTRVFPPGSTADQEADA